MPVGKYWKSGDPFVWLAGGALAACLLMVGGLVFLILANGLGLFWPREIVRFDLSDGTAMLGQVVKREEIPHSAGPRYRIQVMRGNRDLDGADFAWVDEAKIVRRDAPVDATVVERREWGNFHGIFKEARDGDKVVAKGPGESFQALAERLPEVHRTIEEIRDIETGEIGAINYAQERIRLRIKGLEMRGVTGGPDVQALKDEYTVLQARYEEWREKISGLRKSLTASVVLTAADGRGKEIPLSQVVRIYQPNTMGLAEKAWFYLAKAWEFLSDDPREANTEGGVFPAIFGTVMMVMIMSVFVTPLGILAALYLREYAKQGPFVSAVRIAVNNLAGVPSIVFGVFGVGFFIYWIGGGIDRIFYPEALPAPTFGTGGILWASLTLALLTVPVVIVATEEGLAAIPKGLREASLALGATKFETTWRVVLPALTPSILTGLILAMARAAGEVAPLMITGVVKLAPSLPVDGVSPFLHLERKFMHLGFHIYDVGFQSPNADAARPMVFATTLLLLLIVIALNLTAIVLRKKLRKKYSISGL